MKHIVALSGGKDSSALAIRLQESNPDIDYEYVFTPTGDELPDMKKHFINLEKILGKKLINVNNNLTLKTLTREQKMLPNWRARFCTRILKIQTFQKYLMDIDEPIATYVGLRADEPDREGAIYDNMPNVTQLYPFKDWGWTVVDVKQYLVSKGVSVPPRTDCARCFWQTLGEWWDLWKFYPEIYEDAVQDEEWCKHTYRSEQRDKWPASLKLMRMEFEKGKVPRGASVQVELFEGEYSRRKMCRVCSL